MKTKMQKFVIKLGVVFFVALGLLTYFSGTIDRMLLPNVKVCEAVLSDLEGNTRVFNSYLVPKSVVITDGDSGRMFYAHDIADNGEAYIGEIDVVIKRSDDMYYEVANEAGDMFTTSLQLVYSTSKSIKNGDRVYVVEENQDED